MSHGHFWLTYPLLAWRLSPPRVLSYKICEFRYSYFIQSQPVPQPLCLRRCRHSIASFGTSKPTREVFQWIFWHLFRSTSRHRGSWVPSVQTEVVSWCLRWPWTFCTSWSFACQETLFEDRHDTFPDGSMARAACAWLDILWLPLLHQRCLWMLCTHSEIRRQGWGVESTMGVWQCQKSGSKTKMN